MKKIFPERVALILSILLSFFITTISLIYLRWFIFVAFLPFFYALHHAKRFRHALWIGYFWGILFFSFIFFWVTNTSVAFFIGLLLYNSLFIACFSGGYYFIHSRIKGWPQIIGVPLLWISMEYLRSIGFLGMPVGLLGYWMTKIPQYLQMASVIGCLGLSFYIVFINSLIFALLTIKRKNQNLKKIILGSILAISFIYPYVSGELLLTHASHQYPTDKLRVLLVQANISPDEKWNNAYLNAVINRHEALTQTALGQFPDLVIWPETAIPCFLFHPKRKHVLKGIQNFVKKVAVPFLIGTEDFISTQGTKRVYNTALLFNASGEIVNRYDKIKLVPFIEQAPFYGAISFLRHHGMNAVYTSGKQQTIFNMRGIKFSVLICFEGLFNNLIKPVIDKGTHLIINITNDAPSLGQMRFYYEINKEILIMRAVENRCSIVRVANNGISTVIDPWGKILMESRPLTKDVLIAIVPIYSDLPHL